MADALEDRLASAAVFVDAVLDGCVADATAEEPFAAPVDVLFDRLF